MQNRLTHAHHIYLAHSNITLNHCHLYSSPSTNSELIANITSQRLSHTHPYMLTANTQTAGRGQRGRTWQSPKGNVYLSLYHPLDVPVSGLLSLVVGYYLTQLPIIKQINHYRQQAMCASNYPRIGVKWANDIGFYNANVHTDVNTDAHTDIAATIFNKLAGILIEPVFITHRLHGVVMGVGMNVHAPPTLGVSHQEGFHYHAIGLAELWQNKALNKHNAAKHPSLHDTLPSLTQLYLQIAERLVQAIAHFIQMQKTHHMDGFLRQFNEVDVLYNKRIQVIQDYGHTPTTSDSITGVTGIAKGIDSTGSLQLQPIHENAITPNNDKLMQIFTGRIELIG